VSTRTINLTASEREDLFGAHAYCGAATKLGEFTRSAFCVGVGGLEGDLARFEAFEGDGLARVSGQDSHGPFFGHGDLALAGENGHR